MEIIKSVRIYTGSGYEDFSIGKEVKTGYILFDANTKIVKDIKILGNDITISFEDKETFVYVGMQYRYLK